MSARSKPRDSELRQRIAALIHDGGLPLIVQGEVTAGPGSGGPCDACGSTVSFNQSEYEAEYAGTHHLTLHRSCYLIWQAECRRQLAARSRGASHEARRA